MIFKCCPYYLSNLCKASSLKGIKLAHCFNVTADAYGTVRWNLMLDSRRIYPDKIFPSGLLVTPIWLRSLTYTPMTYPQWGIDNMTAPSQHRGTIKPNFKMVYQSCILEGSWSKRGVWKLIIHIGSFLWYKTKTESRVQGEEALTALLHCSKNVILYQPGW